ncbi:hypothetical protein T492DRAFT_840862 [Pavlovales sp. CCMP2436]|nr:hypothetical protein T492DRAFT_840862 [Pavlovales sp. CCMP2436]
MFEKPRMSASAFLASAERDTIFARMPASLSSGEDAHLSSSITARQLLRAWTGDEPAAAPADPQPREPAEVKPERAGGALLVAAAVLPPRQVRRSHGESHETHDGDASFSRWRAMFGPGGTGADVPSSTAATPESSLQLPTRSSTHRTRSHAEGAPIPPRRMLSPALRRSMELSASAAPLRPAARTPRLSGSRASAETHHRFEDAQTLGGPFAVPAAFLGRDVPSERRPRVSRPSEGPAAQQPVQHSSGAGSVTAAATRPEPLVATHAEHFRKVRQERKVKQVALLASFAPSPSPAAARPPPAEAPAQRPASAASSGTGAGDPTARTANTPRSSSSARRPASAGPAGTGGRTRALPPTTDEELAAARAELLAEANALDKAREARLRALERAAERDLLTAQLAEMQQERAHLAWQSASSSKGGASSLKSGASSRQTVPAAKGAES